ncbi:MAG: trigger factor [Saprospiraceae bacterium]
MKYTINDIDDKRFELSIEIEKDDFMPQVEEEMRKRKKEANFKGFRKGKVPESFLKKTYGNGILSEVVNKKMDEYLAQILGENNIELMVSPLIADNMEPLDIDIFNPSDYTVVFDLHRKPFQELNGISAEDSYPYYKIDVDDDLIEKEIENLRKRNGKFIPSEGDTDDDTVLTFSANELEDGKIKNAGYDTEFSVKFSEISDDYKNSIKDLKVDDEIDFDIYKLLKNSDDKKVRDHLLNISEEDFKEGEDIGIGNDFRGTLKRKETFELAELNDELIQSLNIPEVNTEAEFKTFVESDIRKYYDLESSKLLHLEISDKLKEINNFTYSEEYLTKWVSQNYKDKTEEEVKDIVQKSVKDLQWQTIVDILIKKYNVSVSEEELNQTLYNRALQMIGGNPQYIDAIMEYIKNDKKYVEEVYNEMYIDKVFGAIENDITKVEESISFDDFLKKTEKYKKVADTGKEEE